MMAVTHELKTPIAVAQLNLETLQKRKLDEETKQKLIHNTLQEATRLNALCNNILFAAQLDSGAYKSAKQELSWTDIVAGSAENFITRFPKRSIVSDVDEGIYVLGEELLLQMLVNNLIENALKYSPSAAMVKIELKEINNKTILTVSDEGIGIPDHEKKHVLEKFYRTGDEKTRSTKGTGIGLYLCKKIVQGHKGTIVISDNIPKGTIFTVVIDMYKNKEG